jgi:aminoglycoside phosphotransferase (APT) family kinase protein
LSETLQRARLPEISSLPTILDPAELSKQLEGISLPGVELSHPGRVQASVLKLHSGRRCTVDIRLQTDGGWYELVGKIYSTDRSDVYRAMQAIQRAGFDRHAEFSIPQPVAYLQPLQLLLQEKVAGPIGAKFFLTTDERAHTEAAEKCGRWLAHFHFVAPKIGAVREPGAQMVSFERWSRRIARLGQSFADKTAQLLKRLENFSLAQGDMEKCASHGSYSPAQVILAKGRSVAFDWDSYGVAEPARDVASFIVAIRRLALGRLGSIRARDSATETFKRTYLASGGARVEARLPYHQAEACLQLAKYNLYHRVPGWEQKLEAMLDEGLRILERGE